MERKAEKRKATGQGKGKERTRKGKQRKKGNGNGKGRNAICEYAFSRQSKTHIGEESKEMERNSTRKGNDINL